MGLKEKKLERKVCRVCELVNGDTSLKDCYFCDVCKQWICISCGQRYDKRVLAAMLDKFAKGLALFGKKKK